MKKQQIFLVVFGSIIGLLLFLAPNVPEKSIEEIQTSEIESKINQAIQFVNSGEQPMKGIMLLREVLEEEPNNLRAHFQLGIFSITSGQYQKAVDRFEKVKSIDASNIDVDYYLGHAFANLGDRQEALKHFTAFKGNTNDPEKKSEVQNFINELKK